MKSILQDWVQRLGLRHQGVLVSAVRGCDTAPKHDPIKLLVRAYRGDTLNAHCGDVAKAATFMTRPSYDELMALMESVAKDLDHYPQHYVAHLVHAAEIAGYYHPEPNRRIAWGFFYREVCRRWHVTPETRAQLDRRLNADEATFARMDQGGGEVCS